MDESTIRLAVSEGNNQYWSDAKKQSDNPDLRNVMKGSIIDYITRSVLAASTKAEGK
jgi:hypothetical protein